MNTWGGSRQGSGPTVKRITLDRETAIMLRELAERDGGGGKDDVTEVARRIIREAYQAMQESQDGGKP